MKHVIILMLILTSFFSVADSWRKGTIKELASGYDGKSITFRLNLDANSPTIDYSNCTCNSSWQTLCLDPSRDNFDKEYSMLLAAYSANKSISVIFNDNQCFVKAIVIP